jgi:hypothetical protein
MLRKREAFSTVRSLPIQRMSSVGDEADSAVGGMRQH